jgi:serine/threonine-protein kinase
VVPVRRLDDRYRLIEMVARGGWSTVWRGYDERLSRTVAIKLLEATQAGWVRNEASALAKLAHAHIATVYDYGTTGTEHYIVLEFVEGRSMADVLGAGPLPWPIAVRYCGQVASALAAAHRRGLVHRDVAPGNIMLTTSGVKLIDFGLAVVEGASEIDTEGRSRGTPPYVAPERLTGDPVAPAADMFGLGVVLYRAIAGHPPWVAEAVPELLMLQATTDPAPLPTVAGLPDGVAQACLACLSHDPGDRPTAARMADLLADAAGTATAEVVVIGHATEDTVVTHSLLRTDRASAPVQRRRTRTIRLVTAAFGVSLLGGLAWMMTGWGPGDTTVTPVPMNPPENRPAAPACVIAYRLASAPGQPFAATLTVTNTGQPLAPGWRLSFAMPTGGGSLSAQRFGDTMTSGLNHGDSVPLTITAPASVADPQPGSFRVNEQPCLAVPFPITDPDPGPGADIIADWSSPYGQSDAQGHTPKTAKPGHAANNDNANNGKKPNQS